MVRCSFARASCSENSVSKKKVTPGDMWKVRATTALLADKICCFSVYEYCGERILLFSIWHL